jgi:hypothetical protein
MKKQKTRRTRKTGDKAAHKFHLNCGCEVCKSIRNEVAFAHDHGRRWDRMMTPVAHRVYDDYYLDGLMDRFGVVDEDRTEFRQALIDTAEPAKLETDWLVDAALVLAIRRGDIEEPPMGSPGARFVTDSAERAS